jgi:hypothetical protein
MGSFRELETKAAAPAKGGTYRRLDVAPAPARKATLAEEASGALATVTRAIPGLDEANDAAFAWVKTAADLATGKAQIEKGEDSVNNKAFKENLTAARTRSKAAADDFGARHPKAKALSDGVGMAIPAAIAMFTGGGSLAPQAVTTAPTVARGLVGAVKRIATPAAKGGLMGALSGDLAGVASEGTLSERASAGNDAILPSAALGGIMAPAAHIAGAGMNLASRAFLPQVEKEMGTAGRILAARAPEVASAPSVSTPDGLMPFERMGGGGRSLARAVAAVPGPGKDTAERVLAARQAQAPGRMLASITRDLGDDGRQFHPNLERLDKERLTDSKPLFEAAFDRGPVISSRLDDIARRPSVKDAVRRAFRLAMEEGEDPRALGLYNMEDPAGWVSETPPTARVLADAEKVAARGGAAKVTRGPSLVKFIADGGGIKDTGGDVAAMDGRAWNKGKAFQRRLIGPGADADEWALRAWERGYFPQFRERPTANELLDAIGDEMRGKPTYAREADVRQADRARMLDEAEEMIYRGGRAEDIGGPDDYVGRPEPETGPVFGEAMTPKSWHYVKRGLDDLIESKRDPVTGKLPRTDEMRLWDRTRRELRGELTSLNPEYGVALKAYAGPSRQIDALHLGRRLATGKVDAEDIESRGANMSADELDALRLGVSRGLSDLFRSGNPQAAFRKFANDGVAQDRLRAAFRDNDAYGRFMQDIDAEVRAQRSYNDVLAGSRTTPLREDIDAANDAAAASPVLEAVIRRMGGQSFKSQAAVMAIRNWERARQPGLANPEVSRMLADALFEQGDPETLLRAMIVERVISPQEVDAVIPYLTSGTGQGVSLRQRASQ